MLLVSVVVDAHSYVVCVGIADYPGLQNDLRVSANDALVIQRLYTVNGHADVRCFTYADALVSNVKTAMIETFSKAGVNDAVIFFFSGHGVSGGFICHDGFLSYTESGRGDASFSGKDKNRDS